MILSSLRGKIFLLVVAVLLSLTTTMMLVTQRDVTATVAAGEQHAIGNVMDLLRRDLDSRWATLLQERWKSCRAASRICGAWARPCRPWSKPMPTWPAGASSAKAPPEAWRGPGSTA